MKEDLKNNSQKITIAMRNFLWVLRILIGWHFLYEGIVKLLIPDWSSANYLMHSKWIFSGIFQWIATNYVLLTIVDWLNIFGLCIIGLALVMGVFTRVASLGGMLLLLLYYLAYPPFIGTDFGLPAEGHYLYVNRNLIELVVLGLIAAFPVNSLPGLGRLINHFQDQKKNRETKKVEPEEPDQSPSLERREWLKNLGFIPLLGLFGYGTVKKYRWESVNAVTGATIKLSDTKLQDLKGEIPMGRIGKFQMSRLIMGGNLIGGWAHARDLLYASHLFKAYNTEKKVFETLETAEKAGINTMNATTGQLALINKYKRITGGKLQTFCQVHPTTDDPYGDINYAIGEGADMIQIQGNCTDWRVRDGEIDVLIKSVDNIRQQGYLAGLGAHSIQALIACDEAGIQPDYYMKTLHHDRYWSAHPKENRIPYSVDGKRSDDHDKFHDNMFCLFPDESIEFMQNKEIPWIAFKVLAGGAIHPKEGFRFAFENGADFICVGMFDWQLVDDANIAIDVLSNLNERKRAWT